MNLDETTIAALTLGVAYAALPGVVNTEALRRGVRFGFWSAASVQIGSLIGDVAWAVVALTGAALLLQTDAWGLALGLLGAGFLFHLARGGLMSALRGDAAAAGAPRSGGSLVAGVIFSIANPAGLAFWTGIGGGMLGNSDDLTLTAAAILLAAFSVGVLVWGFGMAALVSWGRRFATPAVFRAIDALCGLAMGYFGVRLLMATLQRYGRFLPLASRGLV